MAESIPGADKSPPADARLAYRKFEYEFLRNGLGETIRDTQLIERYVLLATAAVWTWLATTKGPVPDLAWWIPSILVFFGGLRCLTLLFMIESMSTYVRKIEAIFESYGLEGWEHYVTTPRNHWVWIVTAGFWLVLLALTIIVPLHVTDMMPISF